VEGRGHRILLSKETRRGRKIRPTAGIPSRLASQRVHRAEGIGGVVLSRNHKRIAADLETRAAPPARGNLRSRSRRRGEKVIQGGAFRKKSEIQPASHRRT